MSHGTHRKGACGPLFCPVPGPQDGDSMVRSPHRGRKKWLRSAET
jgi:hypothetical protein